MKAAQSSRLPGPIDVLRRSYILIRLLLPSSIGSRGRYFKSVKPDRLTVGTILKQAGLSNQCLRVVNASLRRPTPSVGWALIMRAIKCRKGIWWMPWRREAMKDVLRCDKPRGAAKKL
jgi:hypothetical protein